MKTISGLCIASIGLLFAAGSGSVIAQTPITAPPPGLPLNVAPTNNPELQRIQQVAQELNLNQGQYQQIVGIARQANISSRLVRTSPALTTAQKQYRLLQIRREKRAEILTILTPPQRMRLREINHPAF